MAIGRETDEVAKLPPFIQECLNPADDLTSMPTLVPVKIGKANELKAHLRLLGLDPHDHRLWGLYFHCTHFHTLMKEKHHD